MVHEHGCLIGECTHGCVVAVVALAGLLTSWPGQAGRCHACRAWCNTCKAVAACSRAFLKDQQPPARPCQDAAVPGRPTWKKREVR